MRLIFSIFILMAATAIFAEDTIIRHPQPSGPLAQRWEWAMNQAGSGSDFWIGYSIERMMNEDSFIGSFHYPPEERETSLQQLIYGSEATDDQPQLSDDEELRKAAQDALAELQNRDLPKEKVLKEVALLFRIDPARSSGAGIEELFISNLSLSVDLESLPLYWLGRAKNLPSITLLQKIFENESLAVLKEEIITAVGIHDESAPVFAFLKQMVNSNEDEDVRENAVFWMGQQNSKEALDFLAATAENDRSRQIREEAVFAISQVELPAATDLLIHLAKTAKVQEIQVEAIFWLGQKASEEAETALEEFAYNHDEYELQKSVHPHPKIRKEAIFWLSQSDDPRALDTLVEIVQQQ
jgi:hypothetical protein